MNLFGVAIYNGRPYVCKSAGENFILKSVDGKNLYIFAFDLGRKGSENVVVQNGNYTGAYAFDLIEDEIESTLDGETIEFNKTKEINELCSRENKFIGLIIIIILLL